MNKSTFEEELDKKGVLVYTNTGDSMFPLIRKDGDLIVIKKAHTPLKKYDVPLYKRDNGQYVLHRIMKVKKDGTYVLCGDNRRSLEYGITDSHILGVLYSVIHNGNEIKMTDFKTRLYTHVWCDFLFIRRFIILVFDVFKLIKKQIKKTKR
ncbi:MAG: hypothetical protein E7582_07030 [Ruminococcaceae bacterium]|nr:hypothetical protein [Oscillospiraceae bacterium]